MNKIKLPSMVEYLDLIELKLKNAKIDTEYQLLSDVLRVKDFVKQQPNIGMFVPAVFEDGEWRILEAPNRSTHTNEECDQYQTALDNVIFEGFEVDYINTEIENKFFRIKFDKLYITFYEDFISTSLPFKDTTIIKNLEQLTHYNLTLTPKFAKELGLI